MDHDEYFEEVRPLLFSLAYRMLGTRADAEDIVQEAYLRWDAARGEELRAPKSFLTTVVARLALDSLKAAYRKRETYPGTWLPEPLVEPAGTGALELADSLSLAFVYLLESLSPPERVAFLLREAFDAEYAEIAGALETSEANSRQLVTRARKHLQERRRRFPVDRERHQDILRQFVATCATGEPAQLASMLSEDVVALSDGGGKAIAAVTPVFGADKVSRLLTGLSRKGAGGATSVRVMDVNGEPALVLEAGDVVIAVLTIELDAQCRIARILIVRNPDKLPSSLPALT
jgi:RNA polymerase sigma-70 factor (ECF subfamily)